MANTGDANMRALILKRGSIKAQLTRYDSFVNGIQNDSDLSQLKLRHEKTQVIWQAYEDLQAQIEELDPDNVEQHASERDAFENHYFATMALAERNILRMTRSTPDTTSAEHEGAAQVKLPTINLPTFNGAFDQWLTFVDTFQSLIHDNVNISPIQKLHYLRSSLTDDAAQVIHSLEISALNYQVAWDLLKERFDNKRIIIQNHVKALFDLAPISKESHHALRDLLDGMSRHLRALNSLEQPTDTWDPMIIHLVTSKFDSTTKREWESVLDAKEMPKFTDLTKFLQNRCHLLQSLEGSQASLKPKPTVQQCQKLPSPAKQYGQRFQDRRQSYSSVTTHKSHCRLCSRDHLIYQCEDFIKLTPSERLKEIKRINLCTNCLRADHFARKCPSSNCRICSRKHNTLLHMSSEEVIPPTQDSTATMHATRLHGMGHVVLSTAIIYVYDVQGRPHQGRALLDSGSQSCFMSKDLAKRLRLKLSDVSLPVTGVNQLVTTVNQTTRGTIKSRLNNYQAELNFLILPKITGTMPSVQLNRVDFNIPTHLQLADPEFDTPAPIDIILGAEIFWDLLCVGQIKSKSNLPILHKTQLGWVVSGGTDFQNQVNPRNFHCQTSTNSALQQQLSKFWIIEEQPSTKHLSEEEEACERIFTTTTTRQPNGRFIVKLPFRTDPNCLGDSRSTALKRFHHLERKLNKDSALKTAYTDVVNGYLDQGHMQLVPEEEIHLAEHNYYLPHHAVFKESSQSTKLRIVFDGSSRSSVGLSLNDILMVGPTIQPDLFSIIIRFRLHTFVLTADIIQMYRQVLIHPEHVDFQRILWRGDPQLPIQTYRLNTVTFGIASSPFLATRCLAQLAEDAATRSQELSRIIKYDFYIDDLLTGAETCEELSLRKQQVNEVLNRGGFELHKYNSNCAEFRDQYTSDTQSITTRQLPGQDSIKTLGLLWNSTQDCLSYQVKVYPHEKRCTKRQILGVIAGIFDPLGLLGPVIVVAKILMQRLWQLKCGWDETVPIHIFTKWQDYQASLREIDLLKIPRRVLGFHDIHETQLHGFCDASEEAYGACIYLRTTTQDGQHSVELLCARSRVSPLKTLTIPRLELCSALILAQLTSKTIESITNPISSINLWTDSTVSLIWIQTSPHRWKTFVANRTAEIQTLSGSARWRHVKSEQNPADLLSRGSSMNQLALNPLWWRGPDWLLQDQDQWPIKHDFENQPGELDLETRHQNIALSVSINQDEIFHRYSSFTKLIRVTAYCLRFLDNCRNRANRALGHLKVEELQRAQHQLIRMVQRTDFSRELHDLSAVKQLSPKSRILSLSPFIDEHGILRVGGRLQNANISHDQMHQIILPNRHRFSTLLIESEHKKLLHAGTQATLASIRLRYWILSGRQAIKKVIHGCIRCFKVKPTTKYPPMGQLPTSRTTPSRPFSNCGVDFGGPFLLREGGRTSRRRVKAYLALFVCFSTRAVHLELVSSLSAEAFLHALKRFIGRRGKPKEIFSDNATNFAGTNNELQLLKDQFNSQLLRENTATWLSEEGIKWSFIPPASPHFGGLWEAAIKATKHHLRRVVGDSALTFEEMSTLFVQIESCLNSRPLTPISSDPHDLSVLTPGHFLIGSPLTAHGEPSLKDIKINRLSRWQHVQQITQHFWTRWFREYLSQLQQRNKWTRSSSPLKIGDLVLIRDERTPPLRWPLGRVSEVHPGHDGVVRVVSVFTNSGTFKRSVTKLCVLPIDSEKF